MLFFCLFQCSEGKEYQTESKRDETFGNVIFERNVIQRTWSGHQETNEEATRQGGAPSTIVGPSLLHRRTSSSYIYLRTPNPSETEPKPYFHAANFCTHEIPSWGLFRRSAGGASIMEGFYINTIASPMMCE